MKKTHIEDYGDPTLVTIALDFIGPKKQVEIEVEIQVEIQVEDQSCVWVLCWD